jgi:hypothetical protein
MAMSHMAVSGTTTHIVHGHASIMVHPPADHFPHDKQEYVKMDLY